MAPGSLPPFPADASPVAANEARTLLAAGSVPRDGALIGGPRGTGPDCPSIMVARSDPVKDLPGPGGSAPCQAISSAK